MSRFYQATFIFIFGASAMAAPLPTAFKAAPTRPNTEANVIVEEQEVLDTCDSEQICVQGQLFNNGAKPAVGLKLRVDIGGIRQGGKPRYSMIKKVENSAMNPGDRQEFYLTLDRKIPTKNAKGEDKIIEVGKYNFLITPVWAEPKPAKRALKKKPPVKTKPAERT